ncbi:MAG: UDP-N-acetyl glucosamine 2-epimerase, partial [Akkermansiaceae bacterium]|nr:UDP-N-acetyl glucosamine 2-epimerase [Akkermansiaceae bacterium]
QADFLTSVDESLLDDDYGMLTLHRPETVDDEGHFRALVAELNRLDRKLVFPVHPRTARALERDGLELGPHVVQIDPVGYLEMAALLSGASLVLTDSGGLQKEAYWAKVPCLTLRTETEWVETVEQGWNVVLGADPSRLPQCLAELGHPGEWMPIYGDGMAAERIVAALQS